MPDDAPAAHAQQGGSAIFGMVQAFSETAERVLGKRVPDLAADGRFQRFAQQCLEHVHQPLAHLERHVAGEAVADDHVHFAGIDIASFHVADEVDVQVLEQGPGGARQVVAFVLFFADREDPHARSRAMKNVARVDLAHDGELRQHFRGAIHVGAHVYQHYRGTEHGREDAEQRGTFHARHHALHHFGGGHDGARVSGGHEPLGAPIAYQPRGHAHRAIPFGPYRLGGAVFHGHAFAGMDNLDRKLAVAFVLFQFPTDHILLAHQEDFHAQTPGGSNRPFDFGFRGVVSAHCIQRNGQHVGAGLLRNHFANFTTLILAALRTHAVGKFGLVTVGALRKTGCLQGIVRAAGARPLMGVSTFGIRHISTSTNLVQLLPFARASQYSEFQITKRAPAIVHRGFTIARGLVPVLAATGADSFAGLATHPLHRQRQQDLLPEDVLQLQAVLVKSNFRFASVDLDLFLFRDIRGGPVVQIESSLQRKASARQTTVALRHHFHCITPPNAYLPARFRQQLGRTGGVQRGALLQVLTNELNLPGLENLVEADLTQLQLSDTKEHEGNLNCRAELLHYSRAKWVFRYIKVHAVHALRFRHYGATRRAWRAQ